MKRLQVEASPIEAPNELRDEKSNRRLKFNLDRARLNLWKGPVHQNRLADQLIFPLQSKAIQFSSAEDAKEAKQIKSIETARKNEDSLQAKLFGALYKDTVRPYVYFIYVKFGRESLHLIQDVIADLRMLIRRLNRRSNLQKRCP